MKKVFKFLIIPGLLFSSLTFVESCSCSTSQSVRILATSDTHGRFYPYDYSLNTYDNSGSLVQLSTKVNQLRNSNTLLLDAGDVIQDNSSDIFLNQDLYPMAKAMNYLNYDCLCSGNHEYNYGIDVLKKYINMSNAPFVTGNVYDELGNPFCQKYKIFTKGEIKIGVIGMVSPNIKKWDKEHLKNFKVTDPVEETKLVIKEIKDQVDLLVGLVHMGVENELDEKNSGIRDLCNACPELNVVIGSHDHQKISDLVINGVRVVENENYAKTLSKIDVDFNKVNSKWKIKQIKTESIDIKGVEEDPTLKELLKEDHNKAIFDANTVIGRLDGGNLRPNDEIKGIPQTQIQDTALVDLINKVQMYYSGAKVSTTSLGNADANLNEGDIKKCDTSLIYKYSNTLYKIKMTGKQLKKYLEWSNRYFNTYHEGDLTISFNENIRSFNFDMVAGVNFEVDISQEPGNRIKNLVWTDTNEEVKDNDEFEMALNNYRANSHLLVKENNQIFNKDDEGIPTLVEMDIKSDIGGIRELIRDYIQNVKGGVITPECDNSWKIIGNNWNEELHQLAVQQINSGKIKLPTSLDGRTPNVRSITVNDLVE